MQLVKPRREHLEQYCKALETGWSPNNLRPAAAQEQLDWIDADPYGFLASLDDPNAVLPPVVLPDGSRVPRLPSLRRWIWASGSNGGKGFNEFCGSIGLRWQNGTNELPKTCSGHVGYAIVPWRRREGLATAALQAILPKAKSVGLDYIDITTDPDNDASIRVITKAGGAFISRHARHASLGEGDELLYRIELAGISAEVEDHP